MVESTTDPAHDEVTQMVLPDNGPGIFCPGEAVTAIEECEYCGHYPCGCGG